MTMRTHIEQQLEEFECVLSMFPEPNELVYDSALKARLEQWLTSHESHADADALTRPSEAFSYSIRFVNARIDNEVPELEIRYPARYPHESLDFVVHCASLSRAWMEQLQTDLVCLATGSDGDIVALQLYQRMAEVLDQVREEQQRKAAAADESRPRPREKAPSQSLSLGRRAIYFHHIIAPTKRRVVKEWALELGLGGFSKIGWPGVVLVEGDERCVQEYVRRLQHLRWKQMVVRGEETIALPSSSSNSSSDELDALRRLPRSFPEFSESSMSEAAALCRDVGVEELFLSVMKIYRSDTDAVRVDDAPETAGRHKALLDKAKQRPAAKR
ncbi:hypothetical protein ATCC90586_009644 [Pythium insidiosum]|nr:hypothetical protein ATCC90586_009644 [Pythium insidiosum]